MTNLTSRSRVIIFAAIAGVMLSGCGAVKTSVSKRNLDVQTRMSDSIFLEPLAPENRVAFVEVRNSSDRQEFSIERELVDRINGVGWRVTQNPDDARVLLQLNVLQIGRAAKSAADDALAAGPAGAVVGAVVGSSIGSGSGQDVATGVGLVGGALASIAIEALVDDVTYTMITDIRVSERPRAGEVVREQIELASEEGASGQTTQSVRTTSDWKRYETRVVSTANQANLELVDAIAPLRQGLINAVSGVL